MTYHLATYGCQMNFSDSERIAAVLEKHLGFRPTPENKAAILIFNLCSVRQSAVNRVWGNFKKTWGKRQPLIIFTGCILPPDREKIRQKNCLVLNIKDLPRWPSTIKKTLKHKNIKTTPLLAHPPESASFSPPLRGGVALLLQRRSGGIIPPTSDYLSITPQHSSPFTAYVPIMTGCNNFCSYCAVPYTRGREYSRPPAEIINEVSALIKKGYKEIILLGQNVNSYQASRADFLKIKNFDLFKNLKLKIKNSHSTGFPALLALIDNLPGHFWLTFLTSHPKDLSPELINCFQTCEHLIPYLHLALQSGSNKILKSMNRHYTAEQFIDLTKKVRTANPNVCLSTDIIVGFPGETEKDFLSTAAIMKKIKFDMAYLAEYSPRPGTAAARLKDNISPAEKTNRKNILNEILKTTALANNQKLLGQTLETLVVSQNKKNIFGRTKNFKNVKIITTSNRQQTINNKKLIGQFVNVKITATTAWNLEGILIK